MSKTSANIHSRIKTPDFQDLPWEYPLSEWSEHCSKLEKVAHGLSRHPVVFVNEAGSLYTIKELPARIAEREYNRLVAMEDLRQPVVSAAAFVILTNTDGEHSALITRFLERSLPYRLIFMSDSLDRYRKHLLDAMAGLLVQLHLAGVFWGDCSLSNTLFRRDAGALQAYLVDAETSEIHLPRLMPALRMRDLEIMKENVVGDLIDLTAIGSLPPEFPVHQTGEYIRLRYRSLWEEITREETILPGEHFRIQERIRVLNKLGFSVKDIEILSRDQGSRLRLRVTVTDRSFHRDQLFDLTGMTAEENQARTMINEINEYRAILSQEKNTSVPLSAAAYHWLENVYRPVIERLQSAHQAAVLTADRLPDWAEAYCQVLEHKWYLSERAQRDVGHLVAVDDFIKNFAKDLHFPKA